ncbi:MAG: lipopolysaccharide heptosyltransferase I [Proteobacteria bacterium]|nr:lipopolysaccharide heptosyltransferase I [Pseudomonadota bacterium]HQR03861.1 lipopolysaccharide heptosyltransferase I [Rhodocyclaceae bacterium]
MRILLVKTSSLGDMIHNLPVVSDLHRRVPDARIDWVVEEGFADIPRLHPGVERVIPLALRRWRKRLLARETRIQIAAFRRDLQENAYDVVLDTQGLIKSAFVVRQARLAPAGRRCGFSSEAAREPLAARGYDEGFSIPRNAHAVERNRWLAAAVFSYLPDLPLEYGLVASPLSAPWVPPRDHAILLTATSRDDKLWPEAHWMAFARQLDRQGICAVLPAGSPEERLRAMRIATAVPGAIVAPSLGIAELAGLMAGARAVVGVDTGLTHLGAALGKPTLALFCGSDPSLTGVHADGRVCNLGGKGAPPAPEDAFHALCGLLA